MYWRITLDSFEHSLQFKQEDIHLLEAIGHQAAIALEKSSLYFEKETMVRKLSQSIEIHRNLANLVVNGEGIQSIIADTKESSKTKAVLSSALPSQSN